MIRKTRGFTLIELLIVVAIIAILAAIAVPNFLEAQVRSKVSRVRSDLRVLATAIEAYHIDHNHYPLHALIEQTTGAVRDPWIPGHPAFGSAPGSLNEFHFSFRNSITTPVSYITSIPQDPFFEVRRPIAEGSDIIQTSRNPRHRYYLYSNSVHGSASEPIREAFQQAYGGWRVWSGGPDGTRRDIYLRQPPTESMRIYDPTNGTISVGDIWRTQRNQDGSRPTVPGYVE